MDMVSDLVFYTLVALLFVVFLTAALAGWKAAPYVPTWQRDVRRMLKLAAVKPGEMLVDLGAGDGRFLITAAKEFGARGIGYEFSILPYLAALLRIALAGVRRQVRVEYRDFFQADLSVADVITCFLTPKAMEKLEPKFARELKAGCRVVSYAFKLPGWIPLKIDKPKPTAGSVFLYRVQRRPDTS